MPSLTKLSKFLTHLLRHNPHAIGLSLDNSGWALISELVEKTRKSGVTLTPSLIREIVGTSNKQRFSISSDGLRIRANQGHSIPVELGLQESEPPEILYHGTSRHSLNTIRREGIKRGTRNHVHLSPDMYSATCVGARHGQPVVINVLAGEMFRQGLRFICSENGVWLIDYVPPEYLKLD